MVGRSKMKDWKAGVRNWKAHEWGGKEANTKGDSKAARIAAARERSMQHYAECWNSLESWAGKADKYPGDLKDAWARLRKEIRDDLGKGSIADVEQAAAELRTAIRNTKKK
jgi:hypothetical protein